MSQNDPATKFLESTALSKIFNGGIHFSRKKKNIKILENLFGNSRKYFSISFVFRVQM